MVTAENFLALGSTISVDDMLVEMTQEKIRKQDEAIMKQLAEMKHWAESNKEVLRWRKRNDGKDEQTICCFRAKLRQLSGGNEKV